MAGKLKETASFSRNHEPSRRIVGHLMLYDIRCTGFKGKGSLVLLRQPGIAHYFSLVLASKIPGCVDSITGTLRMASSQ